MYEFLLYRYNGIYKCILQVFLIKNVLDLFIFFEFMMFLIGLFFKKNILRMIWNIKESKDYIIIELEVKFVFGVIVLVF